MDFFIYVNEAMNTQIILQYDSTVGNITLNLLITLLKQAAYLYAINIEENKKAMINEG